MSKASLSTDGGVPIGYKKSEFYTLTSSGKGDYVPIDLEGALEVVLRMDNSEGNITAGWITDSPVNGSPRMLINAELTEQPLVIHSTDGRLFFESRIDDTPATLLVWVIRG